MSKTPKFTVFTPTFNREGFLPQLYESLKSQIFKDFEFLIIDDGSKDNTRSIVETWINDNVLNVRYYYQENQGKHTAFNRAIIEARGELFVDVDSDDYLLPNALQTISDEWDSIIDKDKFAGLECLCRYENGEIIGTKFEFTDKSFFEIKFKYNTKGDKAIFCCTNHLKNHSLPVFKEREYVFESILYNRLSRNLIFRTINIPLMVKQYLPGGISDSNQKSLNSKIILYNEMNYYPLNFSYYIFANQQYVKFSLFKNRKVRDIFNSAINRRTVFLLAFFLGVISYSKRILIGFR